MICKWDEDIAYPLSAWQPLHCCVLCLVFRQRKIKYFKYLRIFLMFRIFEPKKFLSS
jgi:hypothetical protein